MGELRDGYRMVEGEPAVDDYLELRSLSGLSTRRRDQVVAAIGGAWAAVHVVHEGGPPGSERAVAMGRVIGDGGWCFHVVDMAVLPEHQRRGLGDSVLSSLLEKIRHRAPPGAFVTLLGDPPGLKLYERHGFLPTAPHSIGMATVLW